MNLEILIAAMFTTLAKLGRENLEAELQSEVDRYLRRNWADGVRMLWVVRESGTDIFRIGVHEKLNEFAGAAINAAKSASPNGYKLFLLSSAGIRPVSEEGARAEMGRMEFETTGDTVRETGGRVLATYVVEPRWEDRRMSGTVRFGTGTAYTDNPGVRQRMALRHIAACLMVNEWHSLFASPSAILLDGEPLECEAVEQRFELVAA